MGSQAGESEGAVKRAAVGRPSLHQSSLVCFRLLSRGCGPQAERPLLRFPQWLHWGALVSCTLGVRPHVVAKVDRTPPPCSLKGQD